MAFPPPGFFPQNQELLSMMMGMPPPDSIQDPHELFYGIKFAVSEAERKLEEQKFEDAMLLCTNALNMCYILYDDHEEEAKILSIRAEVFLKLDRLHEAAIDARSSIDMDPDSIRAYFVLSQVNKQMENTDNGIAILFVALDHCKNTLDQIFVLTELAKLVPHSSADFDYVDTVHVPTSKELWSEIVHNLALKNYWHAVYSVVIGNSNTPLDGVARKCSAVNVHISDLVQKLGDRDLQEWGIRLAVTLMKLGASYKDLNMLGDGTPLHAALNIGLRTGCLDIMKYILENMDESAPILDAIDQFGNTALHLVTKSGKASTTVGESALRLLLMHNSSRTVCDADGKLPVDYLNSTELAYCMLTKSPGSNLLQQLNILKEKGKAALEEKRYEDALKCYNKALFQSRMLPELAQETAIFYSNRSYIYSTLQQYDKALADANASIDLDPSFFKAYWRKGQILKLLHRLIEAFQVFFEGFLKSSDEYKDCFLLEAAKLITVAIENKECLKKLLQVDKQMWPKILTRLSESGDWIPIKILVLGSEKQTERGIASQCNSQGVNLCTLFDALDDESLRRVADQLIIALLKNKAQLESLVRENTDTPLHALVRLSLKIGNLTILEYVFQTEVPISVNAAGESLLHAAVQQREINLPVGQKIIQFLLERGVNSELADKKGKRPVDYLNPKSPLVELLMYHCKVPSGANFQTLKDSGNEAYKKGKYRDAIEFYTTGIALLQKRTNKTSNEKLSILFGNRAEAFMKLNEWKKSLDDAIHCVSHNRTWYKGYYRVGKALNALEKHQEALDAFVKAHTSLDPDAAVKVQVECLQEAVVLMRKGFVAELSSIPSLLVWAKVGIYLIEKGDWKSAEMAFSMHGHEQEELLSYQDLNLQPLCNFEKLVIHPRVVLILLDLIVTKRCNYRSLSVYEGDTYFHAVVLIALLHTGIQEIKELLLCVLTRIVLPNNDQNLVDINGNTTLHIVVREQVCSPQVQFEVICLLLQYQVHPKIRNKDGKLAVDYVRSGEHELRRSLHRISREASTPVPHPKVLVQNKQQPQPQQQQKMTKRAQKKGKNQTKPWQNRDPCEQCEQCFSDAAAAVSKNDVSKVFRSLTNIISAKHKNFRHETLLNQSIEMIVDELSHSLSTVIPDSMLSLAEDKYLQIVLRLAAGEQWRQMYQAVESYRAKNGIQTLSNFAIDISLTCFLHGITFSSAPETYVKILQCLLKNGANVGSDGCFLNAALNIVMEKEEFRAIPVLLQHGADYKLLKFEAGDTPLHMALTVGLEKDKGYFAIFNCLLNLFDENPKKHAALDPQLVNGHNETLYHLAAKCKFSKHALKIVELLYKRNLPSGKLDESGRIPFQLITNKNDRRIPYLIHVSSQRQKSKKVETKQSNEVVLQQDKEKKRKESEKASLPHASSSKIKSEKEKCKCNIREMVNNVADHHCRKMHSAHLTMTLGHKKQEPRVELEDDIHVDEETEELPNIEISEESDEDDANEETCIKIDASAFDNLEWEVECTDEVWKMLHNKHIPVELRQRAIHRIQLLASGYWYKTLQKRLKNVSSNLHLFQIKLSRAARIIWELAIAFSDRCSNIDDQYMDTESIQSASIGRIYSEVIRVWTIVLNVKNLHRAVDRIVKSHKRGESSIIQKQLHECKVTCSDKTNQSEKRLPRLFMEADVEQAMKEGQKLQHFCPPASASNTEFHILKFYSFSSALVTWLLQDDNTKVDFPFRVTDLEHNIINMKVQAPILLLGRSGTGKTTCCLYRLWVHYLKYWTKANHAGAALLPRSDLYVQKDNDDEDNSDDEFDTKEVNREPLGADEDDYNNKEGERSEEEKESAEYDHLHQMFLTKNAVLCSEVLKNFRELSRACALAKDHVAAEDQPLPNHLQNIADCWFPLILTSRQLLLLLDGSLKPPYYFDRNEDGSLKANIHGWTDLASPLSFIPITEEDSDFDEDHDNDNADELDEAIFHPQSVQRKREQKSEVTYEVFLQKLWPRMNKKLRTEHHPSLVWTEIMSFIKGSFEALSNKSGYLTKEEYVEIGKKRAPNFLGKREKIYELFLHYHDLKKRQRFLFDEADLVFNIYKRLQKAGTDTPWVIHQIFIDEIQDFSQAELCLLIRLSKNPNQMFLTGDTAQSIMRGISFRFSDLRSLFYYAKNSLREVGKTAAIKVPKRIFQLTHNYRSHAGILALATSVLDLLLKFFPDSFDRLNKDQGLFQGPKPVLLESCSFSDLAVLLKGNRRKTSHIEFGAHQVILVANEAARESIPQELRLGLVLTIFEAKGLEFDDVLLYNFFKESQATKEWRVVTHYLENMLHEEQDKNRDFNQSSLVGIDIDILQQSGRPRPLSFDSNQHKILNSELKHLYTALTRARVNVWIFDESLENRAPMFEYFKARKLVSCITAEDLLEQGFSSSMFAERSKPEEWLRRGDDFMKHSLYEVAAKCYQHGEQHEKERLALAHQQALQAHRCHSSSSKKREEFLYAAERYLDCQLHLEAARCLMNAQEQELAAHLYKKCNELEHAANAYYHQKMYREASRCYENLSMYNKAVEVLYETELYDLAIDVVQRYNMMAENYKKSGNKCPDVFAAHKPLFTVENLSYKAAEFYNRMKKFDKMKEALQRLPNLDDRVSFLEEKGFIDLAADVLKQADHVVDAAKLLLHHGKITKAVEFARFGNDEDFLAECLLVLAKIDIKENHSEKYEGISSNLQEAQSLFQQKANLNGQGRAILMLAKHENNQLLINEAFSKFAAVEPIKNSAGIFDCIDLFLLIQPSGGDSKTCRFVVDALVELIKVMLIIFKPSSNADEEKIKLSLNYYGLQFKDSKTLKLYPRTQPSCMVFLNKAFDEEKICKNFVLHIDISLVKQHFCCYLAEKLEKWLSWVHTETIRILSAHLPCPSYTVGLDCKDQAVKCPDNPQCLLFQFGILCVNSGGTCPHLHEPFDRNKDLSIEMASLQIKVDYHLLNVIERRHEFEPESVKDKLVKCMSKEYWFVSCQLLYKLIVPDAYHHRRMTENSFVSHDFLNHLTLHAEVSWQFRRYMESKWYKATLEDQLKMTDIFIEGKNLSNILKLKINFDGWMKELVFKYKNSSQKFRRTTLVPMRHTENRRNNFYISLNQRFVDAFYYLFNKPSDPLEALIKFTKYVVLLGKQTHCKVLPSLANLLMWMEFYSMLGLVLQSKLQKYPASCFVAPANYISVTHFVDAMRPPDAIFLQRAIHQCTSLTGPNKIVLIKDRIEKLINALCGHGSDLDLISKVFYTKHSKYILNGITERTVVLALVLLSNVGHGIQGNNGKMLLDKLLSVELTDQMPIRLKDALESLKSVQSTQDVIDTLKSLLSKRENEYMCQCVWGHDGMREPGIIYNHEIDKSVFLYYFCMPKPSQMLDGNADADLEEPFYSAGEEVTSSEDETGMSKAEKEELMKSETEHHASKVIVRMMRLLKFQKLCRDLASRVRRQISEESGKEPEDEFSYITLDKTVCQICGVRLTERTHDDSTMGNPVNVHVQASATVDHKATSRHIQNHFQFTKCVQIYRTAIRPLLDALNKLIVEHLYQDAVLRYPEITYNIKSLANGKEIIENEIRRLISAKAWGTITEVTKICGKYHHMFLDTSAYVRNQNMNLHKHLVQQYADDIPEEEELIVTGPMLNSKGRQRPRNQRCRSNFNN